jgi:D-alanine-D-alanine ligase
MLDIDLSVTRRDAPSGPPPTLLVWVLAPVVETDDPNLSYYNDYSHGRAEYQKAFDELACEWRWEPVTMRTYRDVIDRIATESDGRSPVVFNLCDGDEINGSPGISVIRYLDDKGLTYTGADEKFFDVTTSKIVMKRAFDDACVSTAAWEVIEKDASNVPGIFERLGSPLILKPAISAGSMGITIKSVVHDDVALLEQVRRMNDGYRGWELTSGGLFVEQFISGPEFTTFIIGSYDSPDRSIVYPPVERVFHEGLPATERFLSFDRLWEIYEDETPVGNNEYLWTYQQPSHDKVNEICALSWNAYAAVKGTGYGRVDLRMDERTGTLFVLEVNAQCGISEDEDYTSIGAILRFAKRPFSAAVWEIIDESLASHRS